ncbi:hypothetical protein NDU88_005646 [Pleurodeles waltl]|uniref:Secreted protein n=1 Tax=Pleurodeles waltl TaxID=8319 RepID=A0AAV7NPL9_PLEWA|nr:hypothetical protein NDU88_005646 [Pleurodeles waltl]
MLLLKCALVEGIHAVWASLQVESALRDCRTAARRGFVAPRWRPPLVRQSNRIVYTARPAEALTFGSGGRGCKPGLQPSPRRREWSERARTGVTRSRLSSAANQEVPAGTAPAG